MARESLWEKKAAFFLDSIVDVFESNPFAVFSVMDFNSEIRFQPFDRKKIIEVLSLNADNEVSVLFEAEKPFPVTANISLSASEKLLQINVDEQYFQAENAELQLLGFLNRLKAALPVFHWGRINAFAGIADFYARERLVSLPECFNYFLGWFTLLHPSGYKPFYRREDLLKIPAFRLDRWPDDSLAVWAYEKPLEFETTRNQEKIIQITSYLNNLTNGFPS
jgi:hypothetical protein